MSKNSRRSFLAAGLAMPAAGLASTQSKRLVQDVPLRLAADGAPEFRYRELGSTGIKVTTVGFGCMITSDPIVIERAADIGVNFFDTARGYQSGNNERMVGAALKAKRKDVILCTKSGGRDKKTLVEHLETSLRELGTDYIDIWHMHGKSSPDQITDDHLEAIAAAKKQGKIRFAGVSTHRNQTSLLLALAKNPHIDAVLVAYNFTMDKELTNAVNTVRQAGKAVIGMKVMAGGFRKIKPGDPLYDKFQKSETMVAALKWVLKNQNVDTTIPSITDLEQLDADLSAMSSDLSAEDEKLLIAQLDYIRPLYCRTCGDCDGKCPKGVAIPEVLRHLSYAEGYGQFQMARENFLELPEAVRPSRCAECAECVIDCPNGVRVAERLARAQELFA